MTLFGSRKQLGDASSPGRPSGVPADAENFAALETGLLARKNVLVTGAGQNIGRAIALEMARQGANLFFTDIESERVEALEKELAGRESVARGFLSDIAKNEDIDALCGRLTDDGVAIDVLVNNVGVQSGSDTLLDFSQSEWERTFSVNLFGPLRLTSNIVRNMRSAKIAGSVLFITSIHQWTVRTVPSYSASKSALGMVVKELALDLAPYGIRVNGIAPGWVAEDSRGEPVRHKYCPLHNTSISPRYIGRAAVYLSADYFSRQTTGTVLKVDGGLSLWNHCCEQKQAKPGQ
jgi:NAD(P)-dependent dehydrogenase (short-subunit alcohol dehydrogenase family)